MTTKQVNSVLWATAVGLAVGAAASLALALLLPLEHHESADTRRTQSSTAPTGAAALPPLASFEKLWNIPLRQALGTAAPQSPIPVTPVAVTPPTSDNAAVPVSLVGTIGTSLAMLKTAANAVEVCAVGETFNGVTVLAVRTAEIDVRFMGRVIKLSKPPEAQ